ncbi:nicotinamide n-methyltransferase [Xylographa trunciseda]|nr:nicotinamide n-methyltransferase [Xylographa trunciseda]
MINANTGSRPESTALSESEDSEDFADPALFQEPDDYYRPESPPSFVEHTLLSGEKLHMRLVGHNPLWGHLLWNGGQVVSEYLQRHAEDLVENKDVLELGAGAGLPGIVCGILGARKRKVLITDYPDEELVENLKGNINNCELLKTSKSEVSAEGYLWGAPSPPSMLLGFDILILADLLFNHSEHAKLLSTIRLTLRRQPASCVLVFFTPYRPWLFDKDMAFFDLARQGGFVVEKVLESVMENVMFAEDRGDELLRRTVYGFVLRWQL